MPRNDTVVQPHAIFMRLNNSFTGQEASHWRAEDTSYSTIIIFPPQRGEDRSRAQGYLLTLQGYIIKIGADKHTCEYSNEPLMPFA